MKKMISSLLIVTTTMLVLNALLVGAGLIWLNSTHRLSSERVRKAVALFKPTLAQEEEAAKQAELDAAERAKELAQKQWMDQAAEGPATLSEKLKIDQQARELSAQKADRLSRDVADLRRRLEVDTQLLAKQRADIDARRKDVEEMAKREEKLRSDKDFQQTVAMYEKLPAKQAKQMLQTLLTQEKKEQVVDYLAAMQMRKAAGVLKEFKTPQEVAQASELLELLRRRGVDPIAGNTQPQQSKAPA
jgi:hypothetical protein